MAKAKAEHPYQLRQANFTPFVETIGGGNFKADYLSWSVCWDKLKEIYPTARYEWVTYTYDNKPYSGIMQPDGTAVVHVRIHIGENLGESTYHDEYLAVRDNRNQAISNPDSAQMENTFRRAVAKGVSTLTGFGIALWTGEDIKQIESYRPEVLLGTNVRPKKGMVTVDQTIKLDDLRRQPTITKNDKARLESLKKANWEGLTEESANVIIVDIKEGVRQNKPATKTKVNKVLAEVNKMKDGKTKDSCIKWLQVSRTNLELEAFQNKMKEKVDVV